VDAGAAPQGPHGGIVDILDHQIDHGPCGAATLTLTAWRRRPGGCRGSAALLQRLAPGEGSGPGPPKVRGAPGGWP
jgi:hypothetical protein